MNKRFSRNKKGFTLSEVLVTLLILIILFALMVPAIFTIKRNLKQTELDRKAEIIYTAVQDRLSELYAKGNSDIYNPSIHNDIKLLSDDPTGMPSDYDNEALGNKTQSIYYILDGSGSANSIVTDGVLDDDLKDGHWVIEIIPYAAKENESDPNAITSALVYGVYYSEDVDICETGISDDYKHYEVGDEVSSSFMAELRYKNYRKSRDYGDAKIGYYGGSNATSGADTSNLSITDIRINSNEEVNTGVVKVKAPLGTKNGLKFTFTFSDDFGNSYDLIYKDGTWTTSGGSKTVPSDLLKHIEYKNVGVNYTFTFTLDDLSSNDTRFDALYGKVGLVTGSNIKLTAHVECEIDFTVRTDTKSASGNSVFGYVDGSEDYFVISNGRHLQNLDKSSGVETSIKNNAKLTSVAKIINDIDFSENGSFYKEYIDKYFNGGAISYNKVNSKNTSKFVNFKPIVNNELRVLTSTEQYKLINFSVSGSGLFDSVSNSLTISNIDLTGERVFSGDTAGGLIGTINSGASVTIDHVQSYLDKSNGDIPSSITSDQNVEAYRWIKGSLRSGGLVGINEGTLNITSSSVSTVVGTSNEKTNGSITGGLVASNGGNLSIENSYADNYLYGYSVGGLVGKSIGNVSLDSTYCAGFIGLDNNIDATGAGLVVGNVNKATNSYTILAPYNVSDGGLDIDEEMSGTVLSGKYYSTFISGGATNVYYLKGSHNNGVDVDGTSNDISSNIKLGSAFITSGKKITKYQLLGKNLSNYEYPILKEISHYGDWVAGFESGALVYYEEYDDGSYGFEGANLDVSLIGEKDIVGDGYGILYKANDSDRPTSVTATINGKTYTYTIDDKTQYKEVTVGGTKYQIYPLDKDVINPDGAIDDFYERVVLKENTGSKKVYDFNPHFARTVVNVQSEDDEKTPVPSNIGIRSPRHLYNLSEYYDSGYINLSKSNVTYIQERNMDYVSYKWSEYTNKSSITSQMPIGRDLEHGFKDTYNGGCYEIGNVSFHTENGDYVGMFGYSKGTIKNVVLATQYSTSSTGYNVQRSEAVGTNDTVYFGVLVGKNSGSISNSAVAGYYLSGNDGTIYGYANSTIYVGGFVGYNEGTISDSSADGPKLSLAMHRSTCYAGGFVGYNNGSITNAYALNHITSDVSDGKTMIAGFVAYNVGSINQSYCATALTSQGSGSYAYAFGSIEGGGTCRDSYYLYRGSYQFVDGLYSYDRSDSSSIASYKTYQQLKDQRGVSKAQNSYYHALTTELNSDEKEYPYRAVVKDSDGNYVHYGEWQVKPSLGVSGVFYWEHEENGQNNGYKITYIGSENGTFKYQSTICTSHDDGGVITEYGYGYYVGEDYEIDSINVSGISWSYDENNNIVNSDVKEALESQIPGITFYPYTTTTDTTNNRDYIYLNSSDANGKITIVDGGKTYEYAVSPFFANALSVKEGTFTNAGKYEKELGKEENPYEVRSADQLQYINWNYQDKSATNLVSTEDNQYQKYNYLMYTTITGTGTQSKDDAGNKDASDYVFKQSHDLNADSIDNFVPIAGASTSSGNEYNTVLYTWFGGTYDGQSYKIQELSITSKSFTVGLFGVTAGANIKNTILYSTEGAVIKRETTNADPDGAYSLGGLIGVAYDYSGADGKREITNCAIAGYTIEDDSQNRLTLGEVNIGGLIGVANVNVNKCSSVVDIVINCTHYDESGNFTRPEWGNFIRVGGIAGAVQNIVQNSYSGGEIRLGDNASTLLNETYATPVNNGDGTYSSSGKVNANSTDTANYDASTHIFLSGIAGSGFTMNYQNFTGNNSIKDGNPIVTNCYTYITFPKMEGTIRSITMFANIADRYAQSTVTGVTITNCYYLDSSADINTDDLPNYKFTDGDSVKESMTTTYKGYMLEGSAKWMWKVFKNDDYGSHKGTFDVLPRTYSELTSEKMITDLNVNNDNAFGWVTSKDSRGQSVDGKYSFNAGTSALDGKNYPFPTVVTQDNKTINVHYGTWPFSGAYWEKGIDTLDIFDNMANDGYAYKTIKLIKNNDTDISLENLTVKVDESTPYVEIIDGTLMEEDDCYKLSVKALKIGTARITATWGNGKSAEFLLTVTANLNAGAEPNVWTLNNGESGESTLSLKSAGGIDYSNNENVTWDVEASKKVNKDLGDVEVIVSKNKVTITSINLNAKVYATATYNYNGEKYSARTVIDVSRGGVVGFGMNDGTSSQYNEGIYTEDSDTVTGKPTTYDYKDYSPSNKSTYFVYEVNAETTLEDNITTYSATYKDSETHESIDTIFMEEVDKSDITTNTNDFKTIPLNFYFISSDLTETKKVDIELTITHGETIYKLTLEDVIVSARPYELTLNANGGLFYGDLLTKVVDITNNIDLLNDISIEKPTKTGYTFSGWTNIDGTEVTYIDKDATSNDITVYAKWEAMVGNINFDPKNGDEVKEDVKVAYNSLEIEQYPVEEYPTKTGYKFVGWYTDDATYATKVIDEKGKVVNNNELNKLILSGETQTLYAKWNKQFTLVYDLGSGNQLDSITVTNGDTVLEKYPDGYDTYGDYKFAGWYYWKDADGNDVVEVINASGKPNSGVTIDGVMTNNVFNVSDTTDTITLHAKWKKSMTVTGYFETDSLASDGSYIIVYKDSNGNIYALQRSGNNVGALEVSILEAGNNEYISSDTSSNAVWTYDSDSSLVNNNSYYLYVYRNGYGPGSSNYRLSVNTYYSSSWSYSNNRLSVIPNRTTYYITYNNGFGIGTSGSDIYLYKLENRSITEETWEYVPSTNDSNDVSNDDIDTASNDELLDDALLEDVSSDVDMYIDIDDKEVVDDGEE